MIELGALGCLRARREVIAAPVRARLAYLSDLHLAAWNRHVARQIVALGRELRPDVFLLGGDLVDHAGGLGALSWCLAQLVSIAPVWAVPGNHDVFVGVERVRATVLAAGGQWLPDQPGRLAGLRVDGRLHRGGPSSGDFRVLCAHDPVVFAQARAAGYALVLAGHLHAGQVVLATWEGRHYPGVLVYPYDAEAFDEGGTRMIVSRGCNDTVPIRWNNPREVVLCELGPEPPEKAA